MKKYFLSSEKNRNLAIIITFFSILKITETENNESKLFMLSSLSQEKKKKQICIFIIWICFLISFPSIFWASSVYVGGDDSKLYYQYPYEYFRNFTLNTISDNALGFLGSYFPQSVISGFAFFVFLIKIFTPFLNTQLLFFGLNLGLSFCFFFLLLTLWIKNATDEEFWVKILGSTFYVFSNYIIYTLWQSQLFSIYLSALFPLFLYLFVRSVIEQKIKFTLFLAIIASVFSIIFLSIPWLMGLLVGSLPLLIWVFFRNRRVFIKHFGVLLLLTLLLNVYWVVHIVYAPWSSDHPSNLVSDVVSSSFREENRAVISGVAGHNSVLYPLLGLFHRAIQEDFHWGSNEIYKKWSLPLLPLNLVFIGIIVAGFIWGRKKDAISEELYLASFFSWLVSLYFFTVNIGIWGMDSFLWMNNRIPGFTMFRNMFDKFGLALTFTSALIFSLSLYRLIQIGDLKHRTKTLILAILLIIIGMNAYPFIAGLFYKDLPLWTTKSIYRSTSSFNSDFSDLVEYVKGMRESSRFLWLPWENTNYIEIEDRYLPNHFYIGVSPLTFLAETSDISGNLGLPPIIGNRIVKNIYADKYRDVASDFQRLNAKYVIVKNSLPSDIADSYLYEGGQGSLFYKQGKQMQQILLGEKIKDFGKRYSLYHINPDFFSERIFLTPDPQSFSKDSSRLDYEKIASYEYLLHIHSLREREVAVFLDPYQKQWDLLFPDRKPFLTGSQLFVFDYANGWSIDPAVIKQQFPQYIKRVNDDGSIDLDLVLYFVPQRYTVYGLYIAGITLAACLIYLSIPLLRKRREKI